MPAWLLFDQQDVHDTLVATSKHKPHLIADMAAMANVPGLATGQARRPVVLQTQQYASQVSPHILHAFAFAAACVCLADLQCIVQYASWVSLHTVKLAGFRPCCYLSFSAQLQCNLQG